MKNGSELRGTSSSQRTLDQRDLAALRPATPARPRRVAPKPILREVTSGIVCFCGERFSEDQALEFMLHVRAEVGSDLAMINKHRANTRRYVKERGESDPEWRRRRQSQSNEINKARRAREAIENARLCACGCGEMTKGAEFKSGHYMRSKMNRKVRDS